MRCSGCDASFAGYHNALGQLCMRAGLVGIFPRSPQFHDGTDKLPDGGCVHILAFGLGHFRNRKRVLLPSQIWTDETDETDQWSHMPRSISQALRASRLTLIQQGEESYHIS